MLEGKVRAGFPVAEFLHVFTQTNEEHLLESMVYKFILQITASTGGGENINFARMAWANMRKPLEFVEKAMRFTRHTMALRNSDAKAMTFVQPSTPVSSHFSSVLSLSFNVEVAFSKDISAPWPKKNMLSSSSPLASMDFHGLSMRLLQRASTGQQKSKLKATHPRLNSRVGVGIYIYIHSYLFEKYIARLYIL